MLVPFVVTGPTKNGLVAVSLTFQSVITNLTGGYPATVVSISLNSRRSLLLSTIPLRILMAITTPGPTQASLVQSYFGSLSPTALLTAMKAAGISNIKALQILQSTIDYVAVSPPSPPPPNPPPVVVAARDPSLPMVNVSFTMESALCSQTIEVAIAALGAKNWASLQNTLVTAGLVGSSVLYVSQGALVAPPPFTLSPPPPSPRPPRPPPSPSPAAPPSPPNPPNYPGAPNAPPPGYAPPVGGPPAPTRPSPAWDLQAANVYSPLWGAWQQEPSPGDYAAQDVYTFASSMLTSKAATVVQGFAPSAHFITDTLTGTDVPSSGSTTLWTTFMATGNQTTGHLAVGMYSAPVSVYLNGMAVSGAACTTDTPPGNLCAGSQMSCVIVPVTLNEGANYIALIYGIGLRTTPGVVGLAAIVASDGTTLVATDSRWTVNWQLYNTTTLVNASTSLSVGIPQPPATTFQLLSPLNGVAVRLDPTFNAGCGAGTLRVGAGQPAIFSAPVDPSAYGATSGYRSILVQGLGSLRSCASALSVSNPAPSDPNAVFKLVAVSGGGWMLCSPLGDRCAGYNADADMVIMVPVLNTPLDSLGAPLAWRLQPFPNVPGSLADVAYWFDGSDSGSIYLDSFGNVEQWRDTRDSLSLTPRVATQPVVAKRPSAGRLGCPIGFVGAQSLLNSGNWDWATPTSLTLVVSQTAGGTLLLDSSGRTLSLPAQTLMAPLGLSIKAGSIAVTTAATIPQRSVFPIVVTATRDSRLKWSLFVNGVLITNQKLNTSYVPGVNVTMGAGAFSGCIHEYIVHAAVLTPLQAQQLAIYLQSKWSSTLPVVQPLNAPPPPSLAPGGPAVPVPMIASASVNATTAGVPAGNVTNSSECLTGTAEFDFAQQLTGDEQLYSLEFRVNYNDN